MKKQYGFKFHPKLVEKGKEQAKKEGRSFNNWVETILKKALKIKPDDSCRICNLEPNPITKDSIEEWLDKTTTKLKGKLSTVSNDWIFSNEDVIELIHKALPHFKAKSELNKLRLANVSQQRELLISFGFTLLKGNNRSDLAMDVRTVVDKFLEGNCNSTCECKDEWLADVRINVMKCKKCGQEF